MSRVEKVDHGFNVTGEAACLLEEQFGSEQEHPTMYSPRNAQTCRRFQERISRNHRPRADCKIERFHQTLKNLIKARPKRTSAEELQKLIDEFRVLYTQQRPHKCLKGKTPASAYIARPKAKPSSGRIFGPNRTRIDKVDREGKVSLRRAGRMHHIGVGIAHTGRKVFLIIDSRKVVSTGYLTGEIIGEHKIEPTRAYWPKMKNPGPKSS